MKLFGSSKKQQHDKIPTQNNGYLYTNLDYTQLSYPLIFDPKWKAPWLVPATAVQVQTGPGQTTTGYLPMSIPTPYQGTQLPRAEPSTYGQQTQQQQNADRNKQSKPLPEPPQDDQSRIQTILNWMSEPSLAFERDLIARMEERRRRETMKQQRADDNITYLSVNDEDEPTITTVDVSPLDEGELLTDKVINDWMEHLMTKMDKEESKRTRNKIHIFNTFFFRTLIKEDYSYKSFNFHEALKFVDTDLWTFQKVIIPVFTPGHWTLALVDLVEGEISYLDSLGGQREEVLRVIRLFFCCDHLWKHKGKRSREIAQWSLHYPPVPRQENGVDCGVYLCLFATDLASDFTVSEIMNSKCSIPEFRKTMMSGLQEFYKQTIRKENSTT